MFRSLTNAVKANSNGQASRVQCVLTVMNRHACLLEYRLLNSYIIRNQKCMQSKSSTTLLKEIIYIEVV